MPDRKILPHLIQLLEDDSPVVQKLVIKKLASFGSNLELELRQLPDQIDEAKIRIALYMVEDYLRSIRIDQMDEDEGNILENRRSFLPGQLISHSRYGYRGVIVDFDLVCLADDEWYESNLAAPPSRNQPWYYILVHLTNRVTYAAQSSLLSDNSNRKIIHPLLKLFFVSFENGQYVRNTKPWPKLGEGEPPRG